MEPPVELPPAEEDAEPDDAPESDAVEYFVDVELEDCWRTSVPNSVHSLQTSSSAPSIFTVVGDCVSAPHISHWTMSRVDALPV